MQVVAEEVEVAAVAVVAADKSYRLRSKNIDAAGVTRRCFDVGSGC